LFLRNIDYFHPPYEKNRSKVCIPKVPKALFKIASSCIKIIAFNKRHFLNSSADYIKPRGKLCRNMLGNEQTWEKKKKTGMKKKLHFTLKYILTSLCCIILFININMYLPSKFSFQITACIMNLYRRLYSSLISDLNVHVWMWEFQICSKCFKPI
jgi:hypothetical protein